MYNVNICNILSWSNDNVNILCFLGNFPHELTQNMGIGLEGWFWLLHNLGRSQSAKPFPVSMSFQP